MREIIRNNIWNEIAQRNTFLIIVGYSIQLAILHVYVSVE